MTRVAYRSSSTKLNDGKIERWEIKRFKWGSQGSLPPELKGDEMRSNGRIWTHQAMCLLSPGCRRGTRCLAVLCMNPHPGMDRYRLIFSLGSVQVVPVSYIALHLSYTESGVENNFSSGVLRIKGTEKEEQRWRWKRNTSFPCGHQWPISLLSPGVWSSGCPLLPWGLDR